MRRASALLAAAALVASSAATAAPVSPSHWRPPSHVTWYWQLQGRLRTTPAAVYDVDGFDTSATEVKRLHADGKHVVCYIDAGTWENWRPDANKFPRSVLGRPNGWPGERWLDIRQPIVRQLMARRFHQQCLSKGFDAVEPDNIDSYQNHPGFPITARDQLRYDEWIARTVHSLGLAVLQKNDPSQARTLEPYFDGVLSEQCNQYAECGSYRPYLTAGKPVLDAEYRLARSRFCTADARLGVMAARYNLALNGRVYKPCW